MKTKPIASGGIPRVLPTTVVHQTFRYSRQGTQRLPPRTASGQRLVLGLVTGSQQDMAREGRRAVARVATNSHQVIRESRLEPRDLRMPGGPLNKDEDVLSGESVCPFTIFPFS